MKRDIMPLISVIVPVYNVEKFLRQCIESIQNQTEKNIQIILVDDGSTDNSGSICDFYAENDGRINVIHQKNAGVSVARNVGLSIAKGKYIAFVDSDDMLPIDAYEKMLNCFVDCELVIGRIHLISEEKKFIEKSKCFEDEFIYSCNFLKDLFEEKEFSYLGYPVDKIYLRKIIDENNLTFNKHIKLNEDRLFVLNYMMYCERINCCNDIVYYYRQRSSGVISETRRNITVTESEMTVLDSFNEMKKICRQYSEELYYICSRKAFESALDLLNRVSKVDKEKKQILKEFLYENASICIKNPQNAIIQRIKILGHTLLKK